MSWIAGMLRFDGAQAASQQLAPMLEVLAARPHDTQASWYGGPAGLACLALKVTPEDAFGAQPLQHAHSGACIVFDGRLDNRPVLIERLGLNAAEARRQPDSWFALQGWLKWGVDCCDYLAGDFAFVVWDAGAGRLALFRDHIGLRPLFYTNTADYFAFASHSAALRALPGVDTGLDERWAADYLSFLHNRAELTAYRGIRKLPGAHLLLVDGQRKGEPRRYWSLADTRRTIRHPQMQDYYDEFLHLFESAVNARLRGAGPVASMLSGGLDSSSITAIACDTLAGQARPLVAVSSVLPDGHPGEETDERPYLEAILRQYPAIDWRPVSASGQTAFSEIETMLEVYDQPTRDVFFFMTLALMREGAAAGARSLLTGFGGDFFVSAKLNEAPLDMFLKGHPVIAVQTCFQEAAMQGVDPLRALRRTFLSHLQVKLGRWKQSLNIAARARADLPAALDAGFAASTQLREQLIQYHRQTTPGFFAGLEDDAAMLGSGLMNEALDSLILAGKSAGVDVSMPLLDRELVGYCVNLPLHVRRHGGLPRSLLRNACRGVLPQAIADRTSKGAFIPDQTRRIHGAVAQLLPEYEGGNRSLPPWLDLQSIRGTYEEMEASASGFNQSTDPIVNVIAPLLVAEFCSRRWPRQA